MRESTVEKYLGRCVKARGGLCEKFTSPGRRNVPDRLVTLPGHAMFLVECKAPGEKPSPAQRRDHKRRQRLGIGVYVADSLRSVDLILDSRYRKL